MGEWVTAEIAHSNSCSYYDKYLKGTLDIIMNRINEASKSGNFGVDVSCSEFIKGERVKVIKPWSYDVYEWADEFYKENTLNERGEAFLSVIIDFLKSRGFSVEEFTRYPTTECIKIEWKDVK